MSAQLFPKFLGAESKASRNGFDRSRREVFSAKVGFALPTNVKHLMPGSEAKIDVRHLIRCDALQTAAFTRFNCSYDFYKVNYNDIYSGFNQYLAQREDKQLASTPVTEQLPRISLDSFLNNILYVAFLDYTLDHLEDLFSSLNILEPSKLAEKFRKFGYFFTSLNPNVSVALEVVRNLDLLGYGNYLPRIIGLYNDFKIFCKAVSHTLGYAFEDYEIINEYIHDIDLELRDSNVRVDVSNYLLDNMGFSDVFANLYGSEFLNPETQTYTLYQRNIYTAKFEHLEVNLWSPCAFNKIFENHIRNPYYDFRYKLTSNYQIDNVGSEDFYFDYVQLFNLDDSQGGNLLSHVVGEDSFSDTWTEFVRIVAIFAPKYMQYPKDMFTGVLPSTQFGDVSVMTDDRSWLNLKVQRISGDQIIVPNPPLGATTGANQLNYSHSVGFIGSTGGPVAEAKFRFDPALAISVLNQRRAEALQRFNENMMRAGNRTKAIFRAHFGYEPKSEQGHEAYYLGSFDGRIDINTVASTAQGDGANLGELGANGVGTVSGNSIRVNSSDFCVVMSIFSITKPCEYDAYGVDRFNELLDKWDFPYSELQNISLAPLDVNRLSFNNVYDGSSLSSGVSRILGYLPRFIERKTDFDVVHGEFYSNMPFALFRKDNVAGVINSRWRAGLFSNFVTPRNDQDISDYIRFLYISPDSADNVFYNLSNSCQETDQFKINMQCDFFCVDNLSVIGLPY